MKRTLTAFVLGVALLFGSGSVGYALDFQKGKEAFNKDDYATALRKWSALAKQGNAVAQFNLGVMYDNGKGVTRDYKEAVKWFRKSAEKGFVTAQYNLGVSYEHGPNGKPQYSVIARPGRPTHLLPQSLGSVSSLEPDRSCWQKVVVLRLCCLDLN